TLVELLLPYAGRCIAVGTGLGFGGAVSHHLGLLTASLGRWQEAGEHFAAALALLERMGAPSHRARTAAAYAAMLLASIQAEGFALHERVAMPRLRQAHELLLQARTIALELGMARVLQDCARAMAE